jgi:hypothetical protein
LQGIFLGTVDIVWLGWCVQCARKSDAAGLFCYAVPALMVRTRRKVRQSYWYRMAVAMLLRLHDPRVTPSRINRAWGAVPYPVS